VNHGELDLGLAQLLEQPRISFAGHGLPQADFLQGMEQELIFAGTISRLPSLKPT